MLRSTPQAYNVQPRRENSRRSSVQSFSSYTPRVKFRILCLKVACTISENESFISEPFWQGDRSILHTLCSEALARYYKIYERGLYGTAKYYN